MNDLLAQFRNLDARDPGSWPALPKFALLVALLVGILVAAYFFDWQDQLDALEAGRQQEVKLKEEYKNKKAQAVIIATGSEVQLALHAQAALAKSGIAVRVVSMPSTTVFDRQTVAYKRAVLPDGVPRIAVEAGVTDGWWKYGCAAVIGIDRFGESAPGGALFNFFHLTVEDVAATVRRVVRG
jgi:transketolase